jgi:DNA-binding LytR/AlgR family response regulator
MAGVSPPPGPPLRALVVDEEAPPRASAPEGAPTGPPEPPAERRDQDETITVELGGVTRFVQRSQVRYVQAQGDYARLHTATGSHLVRIPLTTLEERWAEAGFVRIHRSTLVALPHVDEVTVDSGRWAVRLGERTLRVSRRHTRDVRDRLVRSTHEP